ncbi:MAG TPA: hypothetical protein VGE85_14760 [Terracidiphilus sp.]|jgi:hypothetical protein
MNNREPRLWTLWLSFPLAVLLAAASLGGLLFSSVYSAERRLQAAQAAGNDAGNLVAVVPFLTIAAILALRGSLTARLVWMGTLVYLIYVFLGYAFGLHLNVLFLAYCGILGLSFYALAGSLPDLPIAEIARRFGTRAPVKVTAVLLLLMTLGTAYHWLAEIVPALFADQAPQAVRDAGSFTEPVAVLDLAFGAPASMIAAILLLRHKPLGFVLGPVLLTFLFLSSLMLVPMGMAMDLRGFKAGYTLYAIALGIAAVSAVLLALSLRESKPEMPSR